MSELEPEKLKVEIGALAQELEHLKAMEASEGWRILKAEVDLKIGTNFNTLAVCDEKSLSRLQGQISAYREVMGHSLAVAKELERLESLLKEVTTE